MLAATNLSIIVEIFIVECENEKELIILGNEEKRRGALVRVRGNREKSRRKMAEKRVGFKVSYQSMKLLLLTLLYNFI